MDIGWRVIAPDGTVTASGPVLEMEAAGDLAQLIDKET